ncbi:ribosomal protection-like ABC-F family protein [Facklamia miroungae]|uniref:ATP-binding cassette, subfamily F, member 3 n=1 Tax=Facklamia miroungae TaxID=120956 RepID=A0A1G7RZW3_9LACT|nr:ABC-F family ATP-binding cassette domain-containing protein [Facklamia miroungae]NKZ29215.1 ABC-F family ATP-binding cassette domain-containing protein [Facklamia miroungae]SDG16325.1 ATP-binding cassette, subfamily F, member 3 [Facklamia miroungae]
MILLQANNISRRFADVTLYESVNFSIQERDRIALVGRNGTGKSTLIKQIIGEEPINDGQFSRAKNLKIGYLEQHIAVNSSLTIWDEMLSLFTKEIALKGHAQDIANHLASLAEQGDTQSNLYQETLSRYDQIQIEMQAKNVYQIESTIRTVLHGFGFYPEDYDQPIQSLSGGQKTRIALAKLLLQDYDLLILDEPTNHLDMQTLTWLEKFLTAYQGALLIVSHDRYFLDKVATQVYEIRDHRLHHYHGNYSFYVKEKATRMEQARKLFLKQQAEINRLEDFVQKNIARASTTKRAQSRRKQLEKMERIEAPKEDSKAPRIQFSVAKESGDKVIHAEGLSIGYAPTDVLCQNINLDLTKQNAIAIVGPNGVGKTTLLKTLQGYMPAINGKIKIGTNVQIGYYDQNVNHLDGNVTVLETLWQAHDTTDEWKIRSILGSFLFSGETVEKKVSLLSGGEKARLALALLAADHDNTLLLDEPTNHLDIDSKEVLEEALIDFNGTLLFVSHDRYFINRIATHVFEISPEQSQLYLGDYDYYLAKKEELEAFKEADLERAQEKNNHQADTISAGQLSYEENKKIKSELRKLQKLADEAWADNESLELAIAQDKEAMLHAANTNDHQALIDLDQKINQKQETSNQLIAQWEEYSLAIEAYLEKYPDLQ